MVMDVFFKSFIKGILNSLLPIEGKCDFIIFPCNVCIIEILLPLKYYQVTQNCCIIFPNKYIHNSMCKTYFGEGYNLFKVNIYK